MARPSNTLERRRQIASGLIKVMAKRGYDGASIADVASAARLTPGLVHYHFKNKREILLAALHELMQRHAAGLEQKLASAPHEPMKQIHAFLDFHLGLGASADPEALACWILLSGEALRDTRVRQEFEKALEALAGRLAKLIRDGAFRTDDPRAAASALLATIHGYFVLAATAPALIPRGSAARSARLMAEGLLSRRDKS
jgi:TetR/AcrR family transcriptional repressor of bet genes